ncbi:Ribosomal protein L35A like protein [Aduncisulcus paluster]|uniref:Ribosomal protein L35A like protein n=1 Tax=Aduncisulcus paluster TaxID=2918883 RepID=A0ABQ5JZA5_9EUKA|nr:Ribosomal protein L35A like protein [Aduncisulcus paluster]|eukprot:gnl/Carplike_NY0171/107_a146_8453.p1 GENE.gnl/Carplike_NY0171/107_a146_8453~~gnl/Carplike_NY0171/107_a146_8453.p1  ORF type:complete len:104 (-),score=29.51 gnl/Carplike_NY0171/107_a146_8453:44-355(-)
MPARLYVKGTFLGFRRSLYSQRCSTSLIGVEGVKTKSDARFYLGKRVAVVYKKSSKSDQCGMIWGKIVATHGNSGVVRAKFESNLNPRWMGRTVRVMMYPYKA